MFRSLWMMFLSIYAIVKYVIQRMAEKVGLRISGGYFKIISIAMTILTATTMLVFLAPFLIFRTCLYVALKYKHGDLFGGFLTGMDTLFLMDCQPTVINVAAIYRFKQKEKSSHKELAKEAIKTMHESIYKCSSKIDRCFGYRYYIRDSVSVEDVLEYVDDCEDDAGYITRNVIFDYIQRNCETIKENRMWKVAAFLQPVKWMEPFENEHGKQYAIIITVKHCLGDGTSLMTIVSDLLVETKEESQRRTNLPGTSRRWEKTLDNVYVNRNCLVAKPGDDPLKIEGNSDWQFAIRTESRSEYLPIIKSIRRKLDVCFIDVMNAAISSSMLDYIVKRQVQIANVKASTSIRAHTHKLPIIKNGSRNARDTVNVTSALHYTLPFGAGEGSMKNKILALHENSKLLINSMDFIFDYILFRNVCTYLPTILVEFLVEGLKERFVWNTSNLIGCDQSTYFDCLIDDVFVCVPSLLETDFQFHIFSYDERLKFAATSRRGYVHNREELQDIVDNVFRYIDQAKEEIL